mgnify:CR=1 FL=1
MQEILNLSISFDILFYTQQLLLQLWNNIKLTLNMYSKMNVHFTVLILKIGAPFTLPSSEKGFELLYNINKRTKIHKVELYML